MKSSLLSLVWPSNELFPCHRFPSMLVGCISLMLTRYFFASEMWASVTVKKSRVKKITENIGVNVLHREQWIQFWVLCGPQTMPGTTAENQEITSDHHQMNDITAPNKRHLVVHRNWNLCPLLWQEKAPECTFQLSSEYKQGGPEDSDSQPFFHTHGCKLIKMRSTEQILRPESKRKLNVPSPQVLFVM